MVSRGCPARILQYENISDSFGFGFIQPIQPLASSKCIKTERDKTDDKLILEAARLGGAA
jgi:hypothetical protein